MRFLIDQQSMKVTAKETIPKNAKVINPKYIIGALLHDAALFIPQSHLSTIHHISNEYLYKLTKPPKNARGAI